MSRPEALANPQFEGTPASALRWLAVHSSHCSSFAPQLRRWTSLLTPEMFGDRGRSP